MWVYFEVKAFNFKIKRHEFGKCRHIQKEMPQRAVFLARCGIPAGSYGEANRSEPTSKFVAFQLYAAAHHVAGRADVGKFACGNGLHEDVAHRCGLHGAC